ncbi:hypothetical protein F4X33_21350 [Candidatus Poribacteria bacterium]|nr:hypothetical protein [Candidatus Poribacteria bacterium]
MVEAKRSYRAMLMSMIIPGLGQIYLRQLFKGIIIFIGIILAMVLIYANSLPVTSWRDLTRIDRTETSPDERGVTGQMETYPETDNPSSTGKDPKQWRGYTLYTSDSKFMFRITADLDSHLIDNKGLSTELVREFRKHKVLIYKGATVSTKKEGSWWLIDDYYQTYSVRKSEYGLDVYSTAQWRFRPRWQFKITGLIQLLVFWGYAVVDGWLGRRQE